MSKLLKSIRIAESNFDASAERFFFYHPYLGLLIVVVGMPIFILVAVAISTTAIMLPVSFLLGWI